MLLIKCFLLLFAMTGFSLLLMHKTNIRFEFIPAILTTSVIAFMYAAGLVNALKAMVFLIAVLGNIICGWMIIDITRKNKWSSVIRALHSPGNIFMLALTVFFAIKMHGGLRFSHYDNFSHWGLIIKQMNLDYRLPNFTNANIITFQAYPPGSALFIFFVTRFIGYSEGLAIFSQAVLILSCIWAIFAFLPEIKPKQKTKKIENCIVTILLSALAVLVVSGNTSMYDLLVDTLLSTTGIAGFAVLYYYKNDIKKAAATALPITVAAVLIKNSGILFLLINGLYLLYLLIKYNRSKAHIKINMLYITIVILIPVLCLYLWNTHLNMVFANAVHSKHAMNFIQFRSQVVNKNLEDITMIKNALTFRTFNLDNQVFRDLLVGNLAGIGFTAFGLVFKNKKAAVGMILTVLACDAVYVLYSCGLVVMYTYSMPLGEAKSLAGYERYLLVIYYYTIGIVSIVQIKWLAQTKRFKQFLIFLIIPITLTTYNIIQNTNKIIKLNDRPAYEASRLEAVEKSVTIDFGSKSAAVYCSDLQDSGLTFYILRYTLYSDNYLIIEPPETQEELLEQILEFDILIIIDEDDDIRNLMTRYVGKRDSYRGSYNIDEIFKASMENKYSETNFYP